MFCDTPATNGGENSAHIFVRDHSKATDNSKSKDNSAEVFLGCFQDRVRIRGIPSKLIADNNRMYRGWKVTKCVRDLLKSLWQCETKHQHQNYAENRLKTVKRHTNRVINRSRCPPTMWFLVMAYVCFYLNNVVDPNLADGTKSPIMMASFIMNDISPLLFFYFWQPVHYLLDATEQSFPGKSKESRGRWAGISGYIGHKFLRHLMKIWNWIPSDANSKLRSRTVN